MKRIRQRIEEPHRAGCRALGHVRDGTWSTEWACGETVYRNFWGTRRGRSGHAWLRFRCNCTDCPGVLLLNETDVLLAVAPPKTETGRP